MTTDTTEDSNAMEQVQATARSFAEAHRDLQTQLAELEDRVRALREQAMPALREAVHRTASVRAELRTLIEGNPDLWSGRRRTVVVDGVRVGITKGAGRLEWKDDARVVRRIRQLLPDQAEVLIQTKEVPVRKALGNLAASELRQLGVQTVGADDQVVIKPTDGDVEKIVEKLLAAADAVQGESS